MRPIPRCIREQLIDPLPRGQTRARNTQAERIIAKFGGIPQMVLIFKAIGRPLNPSTILRWTYPRSTKGGTNGLIPSARWEDIFAAALVEGIVLTSYDLDPRALEIPTINSTEGKRSRAFLRKRRRSVKSLT